MCGIVATIGYNKDDVNTMLQAIEHRGKDNRGIEQYGDVILGHNRLSINDVSEAGNQPMSYDGIHLVVNGEIWNYPQLRKEYEDRGYVFRSTSDSEIILFLYKENELERLEGMFSFVILDDTKLIISRDWVGKIPLYIYDIGRIIVASEIKAIHELIPNVKCKFIPKNSLVEIDVETGKTEVKSDFYFNFTDSLPCIETREEIGKHTYDLLKTAVEKRLISDVPIATCLSGGIDSSVITYLLSLYLPNIKAYTVKFDEESRDLYFARMVADHIGIELVEVEIPRDPEILKKKFIEVIKVIEYPSTVQVQVGILQSFIAEQMKEDGIKVAFSGEGSDESYGSYGMIRMFSKKPDFGDIRKNLFEKQYYGNLLRGNNIFMKYGTIELRVPFFDTEFLDYTTNLPNRVLSEKSQWKLPLADAFRDCLPEPVIEQEKRAFQKGTNFKGYIEDIIMKDTDINFNGRKKMFHVIADNFNKIYGFPHSQMKETVETDNEGLYKWV